MALRDLTDRGAVLSAIEEFDQLGRVAFLKKYGFGHARSYFLRYRGRRYDSKAIAGAAHGYQFPAEGPLRSEEFSGGEQTVEKQLKGLGFDFVVDAGEREELRYWAFCANPERYRIREAVQHLDRDTWTTGKSNPRAGDFALIWQTLDSEGRRGIVAFAEIITDPKKMRDDDNPYWVDASEGASPQDRVEVRYVVPDALPLWMNNPEVGRLLQGLSVAKAHGGTIFKVTPEPVSYTHLTLPTN